MAHPPIPRDGTAVVEADEERRRFNDRATRDARDDVA
jgi:hypothetical protein